MGLSEEKDKQAFVVDGFIETRVNSPFIMNRSKGNISVLIAICKSA